MRVSEEPLGTEEFFSQVEEHRYRTEPAIEEFADFASCKGLDVMEAGCGIATDGKRFALAGANYTGVDQSPRALELARFRFEKYGIPGRIVESSITQLPFDDETFDVVYSNGVIHHIDETQAAISEFHRVLKPGGRLVVMVYHRDSLNFYLTIMLLRRVLAALLWVPGGVELIAKVTGESREVIEDHAALLKQFGWSYLTEPKRFLSHNTDGPGNPLSKVYTRNNAHQLLRDFDEVETSVRFLNARTYPFGERFAGTRPGRWLAERYGWHLWLQGRKLRSH